MQKRLIALSDLYQMVEVADPKVSPTGDWIAFVRATRDEHQNKALQSIWLVRPDGTDLRQFTSDSATDDSPCWRPDGRSLAFISDRSGKPQVHIIPVDGGEARQLTYMLNGASSPIWSPDGSQIAFVSRVRADEWVSEDESEALPPYDLLSYDEACEEAELQEDRFDPRVVDRVPFRAHQKVWDERYGHVYVVSVGDERCQPKRVTSGERDFQPPQWTVDGAGLLSCVTRQPDHDMPAIYNSAVLLDVSSGTETMLTPEGWTVGNIKPSPDGQSIAVLINPDALPANRVAQLAVMPVNGGDWSVLTEQLDRTIDFYEWQADSQSLVVAARDAGSIVLFNVPIESKAAQKFAHQEATTTGLSVLNAACVASTAFTAAGLSELYVTTGETTTQLTAFNEAYLSSVDIAPVEHIAYTTSDGVTIDGWYMTPPDYEPGEQYPLALNIHGGPSAMWGATTPSMWLEWQHHAASGYVVFFCNPRGSTGYGEEFLWSNHGDWGDGPTLDVITGVEWMVAQGYADPDRLAITGGSYGGYLTAWIIGHDDRFASAVAQRGVYHLQAMHGVTDIPLFLSSNFQAEPWEAPDVFWEGSPLAYAPDINTPLLIIHSENDYRVPIAEAEQLFTTLKRLGREVQLVRYPREGHELSRSGEPKHIIDRLERIVAWWDKSCKA